MPSLTLTNCYVCSVFRFYQAAPPFHGVVLEFQGCCQLCSSTKSRRSNIKMGKCLCRVVVFIAHVFTNSDRSIDYLLLASVCFFLLLPPSHNNMPGCQDCVVFNLFRSYHGTSLLLSSSCSYKISPMVPFILYSGQIKKPHHHVLQ